VLLVGRGEEVQDAVAADEDAEALAGELVDDVGGAALRGAEVEERVAEREVEDVAAGPLEFVVLRHVRSSAPSIPSFAR